MRWDGQCTAAQFEDPSNQNCKKCAAGISYLGGCAGNVKEEATGLELARRPHPLDSTVRSKARGHTSEGGYLSSVNGWPGSGISSYDDVASYVSCTASAEACEGAFASHVYKDNACIVIDTFSYYSSGAVSGGTVKVLPCGLDRSWIRFEEDISKKIVEEPCGRWGRDCMDVWRTSYDYSAITQGPQFGGVLTGSRGVDRDDGWYRESDDDELFKNHTITPVNQPTLCLTQRRSGSAPDPSEDNGGWGAILNHTGVGVQLDECDGSAAQRWYFTDEGWLRNYASGMCMQFTTDLSRRCRKGTNNQFRTEAWHNVFGNSDSINSRIKIGMFPCDANMFAWQKQQEMSTNYDAAECNEEWMKADLTKFNPEFYKEVEKPVTHGSYFYDFTSGVTLANNVLEFADHSIYYNNDKTNVSYITSVMAGNTSLKIVGDDCAEEGCAPPTLIGDSNDVDTFFWSHDLGWNRTGDPSVDVPGYMSKVIIIDVWTVLLDVTTDILDHLEIRGSLQVWGDNPVRVTLNAFYIDIKGGSFFIGNHTHPYEGAGVTVSLHGDPYVHGTKCVKSPYFSSEHEEVQRRGFMVGCGKRMDVNGELYVRGKERIVERVLDGNHAAGSTLLKVNQAPMMNRTGANGNITEVCDWGVGDEVIVTSSQSHGIPEGLSQGSRGGFIITSVSANCTEFGIDKGGLTDHHIGVTTVEEGGIVIDMRSRVLMLSRNVKIEGGTHPLWDSISGVDPRAAEYGGFIITRPAYKETKLGWDPSMMGFERKGQWHFPQGVVNTLSWMEFGMMGKQGGIILPGSFYAYAHVIVHRRQPNIKIVGVVDRDLISGGGGIVAATQMEDWFWASTAHGYGLTDNDVVYTDNVMIGVAADFLPGPVRGSMSSGVRTHLVERNHWFGGWDGVYCRLHCQPEISTIIGGGGYIKMRNNWWHGGFSAIRFDRSDDMVYFDDTNKIFGASTGVRLHGRAIPGPIHVYKSANGIMMTGEEQSNFVTAECGVGVFSYKSQEEYPKLGSAFGFLDNHDPRLVTGVDKSAGYGFWCTDCVTRTLGDGNVNNAIVIGRTKLLNEVTEFDYCELGRGNWHRQGGASGFNIGGQMTGFLSFTDTDYSGFQYGPRGGGAYRRGLRDPGFSGQGN